MFDFAICTAEIFAPFSKFYTFDFIRCSFRNRSFGPLPIRPGPVRSSSDQPGRLHFTETDVHPLTTHSAFLRNAARRVFSRRIMSHIMVWRGGAQEDGLVGFWHHGILCPDGDVIHYSGMDGPKSLSNARITRTSMSLFQVDARFSVHTVSYPPSRYRNIYPPDEVVRRAESRIGHQGYNLMRDNCESFARWCVIGDHTSFQSQGLVYGLLSGFGSVLIGGSLLGGLLTAVVVQKFWDRQANFSNLRPPLRDQQGDNDSDGERT